MFFKDTCGFVLLHKKMSLSTNSPAQTNSQTVYFAPYSPAVTWSIRDGGVMKRISQSVQLDSLSYTFSPPLHLSQSLFPSRSFSSEPAAKLNFSPRCVFVCVRVCEAAEQRAVRVLN